MKKLHFLFILFIVACLFSCKKSSVNNNSDNNGKNSTIFHDSNLKLVSLENGNIVTTGGGAYDIFGNGTMYISIAGGVSPFSYQGSAGNSSSVVGTGPAASYSTTYFNHIDASLIVEILDTTITRMCNEKYNFAKFFPLVTYSQSTFALPQASYSKFMTLGTLSEFIYTPVSSCSATSFIESPFANGGYFIFRVRNTQTNKSNYGWIRVTVSSGNNYVSTISFSEIAYSKTQDVLLAPGYYEK